MKLSEAIELGHMLIEERRDTFFDSERNCGCVLGSAYVSTVPEEFRIDFRGDRGGLLKSFLVKHYKILKENLHLKSCDKEHEDSGGLFGCINRSHNRRAIPRLQIAQEVRELEDRLERESHAQIPQISPEAQPVL